jgi:adenosylcobyric acid synthase
LELEERALIRGIVINKFRGQRSLLESGITWLEERTGIPVIGVVPWLNLSLPAEDSLDLFDRRSPQPSADLAIAVIRLPRIANFTDFDPLSAEPTVNLYYVYPHQQLGTPDAVILPGSKTTISDLRELQASGMAKQLQDYAAAGGTIIGICGGLQMLGRTLSDPEGTEGETKTMMGLGLLPLETSFTGQKVTRQRQVYAQYPQAGLAIAGYEIHQGRTQLALTANRGTILALFDDPDLGYVNAEQLVWGSYLHGLFENGPWRRAWLNQLRHKRGLPLLSIEVGDYSVQRERLLDEATDAIAPYLDLEQFL